MRRTARAGVSPKLLSSHGFRDKTAKRVTLEGMQMMGGYGYSSEYDMERLVRQALVSTIYGGTSEIQRNIIAKTLGL